MSQHLTSRARRLGLICALPDPPSFAGVVRRRKHCLVGTAHPALGQVGEVLGGGTSGHTATSGSEKHQQVSFLVYTDHGFPGAFTFSTLFCGKAEGLPKKVLWSSSHCPEHHW